MYKSVFLSPTPLESAYHCQAVRKILPQGIRDASAKGGDVSAAAVNTMPLKIHADGAQIDVPACFAICKSTMKAILEVAGWGRDSPFLASSSLLYNWLQPDRYAGVSL